MNWLSIAHTLQNVSENLLNNGRYRKDPPIHQNFISAIDQKSIISNKNLIHNKTFSIFHMQARLPLQIVIWSDSISELLSSKHIVFLAL